jgi:hypothetical protein
MRNTLFLLVSISAAIVSQAQDRLVAVAITAPAPIRLAMPPPAALTNRSPEKSVAAEQTRIREAGKPGRLSVQTPPSGASPVRRPASLAVAETSGLHQSVTVNRGAAKSDSKPKIKADRLVFEGGNLPAAISNAKKLSDQSHTP